MSRAFWRAGLCLAVTLSVALPWAARAGETAKVHLIGTGGPELTPTREGMCTLIEASGQTLLFDVGRGALQNIYLSRIDPRSATKVFLTHLHSDHICDLNDVVTTQWIMSPVPKSLRLFGPPRTGAVVAGMTAMLRPDVEYRLAHHDDLTWEPQLEVVEVEPGTVFDEDGLRVIAARTDHRPVEPTLGYRIESEGTSVVIAGDTVPCAGLDELCRSADA